MIAGEFATDSLPTCHQRARGNDPSVAAERIGRHTGIAPARKRGQEHDDRDDYTHYKV